MLAPRVMPCWKLLFSGAGPKNGARAKAGSAENGASGKVARSKPG
jgi:hypothetical protein